jgi:hypothetical protein
MIPEQRNYKKSIIISYTYFFLDGGNSTGEFLVDREHFENYLENINPNVSDEVNHPAHYTSHPSGVECITVTEHFNFNIGNVIKYLWRCDLKGYDEKDLQKASWYLNREIKRRKNKE